jgi:hypothetical protein
MDTLVLDGKNYVKASKAAEAAGYTADYVGQLCRSGKIDAHLVGRSWYVNTDQLGGHRVDKKRMSRVKAREQVRRAVEENTRSLKVKEVESLDRKGFKNYEKRGISYERDEAELIPQVKKLHIEEEPVVLHKPKRGHPSRTHKQTQKKEPAYTVENEGNEVKMTGTLEVIDVTDEQFVAKDTVVMTPRIIKNKSKNTSRHGEKSEAAQFTDFEPKSDFLAKLAQLEEETAVNPGGEVVINSANTVDEAEATSQVEEELEGSELSTIKNTPSKKRSLLLPAILIFGVLILVLSTIHAESNWTYNQIQPSLLISDIRFNLNFIKEISQ